MRKELRNKLIVCGVGLALIAAMLIVYFCVVKPERAPIEGTKTVALEIVYADQEFRYENLRTDTGTVSEFLREYDETLELGLETESGQWGLFITAMKNTAAADGFDYVYTVNGGYADAIDVQPVRDGDVIRFEYCKQTWDDNWNPIAKELGKLGTQNDGMPRETVVLIAFGCVGGVIVAGMAAYLIVGAVKKRKSGAAGDSRP